jgi:hypothetical protein
MYTRFDSSC